MATPTPTSLDLHLPADPQLLRVMRLTASGMASLGHLDLASTEEVRVAVDELVSRMIGVSDGAPLHVAFELTPASLCVEVSTELPDGAEIEPDPLSERLLDALSTTHQWSVRDGRAVGRVEKQLPT